MDLSQFLQRNGLFMKTKVVHQAISNHSALQETKLKWMVKGIGHLLITIHQLLLLLIRSLRWKQKSASLEAGNLTKTTWLLL